MLSEEYTEIVGDIFIGGEWQTHDLQPKIVALEEQLKIEKQKHLDTSNWALEQQERGDTLETKLKDAEAANKSIETQAENYIYALKQEKIASEKREAGMRELLKTAHTAIASLDTNIFGSGNDGEIQWPIRDELLDKIAKAIKEPAEAGK